jgi:hypothetical protein
LLILFGFSAVTMFEKASLENGPIRRNGLISYWLAAMPEIQALNQRVIHSTLNGFLKSA